MTDNVTRLAALLDQECASERGEVHMPVDKLAARLAAAGVTVGLDVERLALAMQHNLMHDFITSEFEGDPPSMVPNIMAAIAAEYDRLAAK